MLRFGTPVAIKVIDQDVKTLQAAGAQMEAVLGECRVTPTTLHMRLHTSSAPRVQRHKVT